MTREQMTYPIEPEQLEDMLACYDRVGDFSREDVNAVLRDLGRYIGVDDLELDEQDTVVVSIDRSVTVALLYLSRFRGVVAAAEVSRDVLGNPRRIGLVPRPADEAASVQTQISLLLSPDVEPMMRGFANDH